MKAFVVKNAAGKVVAHVRVVDSNSKDTPTAGRPLPPDGHTVHETVLTPELLAIKDAAKLHRALEKHLGP
jgi:hypothetical protein